MRARYIVSFVSSKSGLCSASVITMMNQFIEAEWRIYALGYLIIIGLDNGLSPGWRQAIIWTNNVILLIRTLGTNFSEIWSEICIFSFKKMHLKMSSGKWRTICQGLNVLNIVLQVEHYTGAVSVYTFEENKSVWVSNFGGHQRHAWPIWVIDDLVT